jgi:hypothetical protein
MRKQLYVSPCGSYWKVHYEHRIDGLIYRKKTTAVRAARGLVGIFPKGTLVSIRVRKGNGKFQTEWTYGNDSYPPKG